MEYNFAEKVDKLLQKERRTKKSLYETLSMTSQGFDAMMKNNSFSAIRLADIANFFGIDIRELYGSIPKNTNLGVDTDEPGKYLQDHLSALEQNFNKLLEQLSVKDQQIAGLQETQKSLQDMLKLVLGKSEGATFTQLSDEETFKTMMDLYLQAGLGVVPSPPVSKPRRFELFSPAKLVALSSF